MLYVHCCFTELHISNLIRVLEDNKNCMQHTVARQLQETPIRLELNKLHPIENKTACGGLSSHQLWILIGLTVDTILWRADFYLTEACARFSFLNPCFFNFSRSVRWSLSSIKTWGSSFLFKACRVCLFSIFGERSSQLSRYFYQRAAHSALIHGVESTN